MPGSCQRAAGYSTASACGEDSLTYGRSALASVNTRAELEAVDRPGYASETNVPVRGARVRRPAP
jgi:hypothetical protein